MSLESDFKESSLRPEEYLRKIWAETELTGDALSDIDPEYLNLEDVERTILDYVNRCSKVETRKDFYRLLLLNYLAQEEGGVFMRFYNVVNDLRNSEDEKREMIANLFTRVLRGELATSQHHRTPADASQVLSQAKMSPWRIRVESLIRLEQDLRCNGGCL